MKRVYPSMIINKIDLQFIRHDVWENKKLTIVQTNMHNNFLNAKCS